MSTLEMLITAVRDTTVEHVEKGSLVEGREYLESFLLTIKKLNKREKRFYSGLRVFLTAADGVVDQLDKKTEESEKKFNSVGEFFSESEQMQEFMTDWESILSEMRDGNDDDKVVSALKKFMAICEYHAGELVPGKSNDSPQRISNSQLPLEILIGSGLWAVVFGLGYLFVIRQLFNFSGFGYIVPLIGLFLGIHYTVCGIGTVYYVSGTRGYALRVLFILFVLAFPSVVGGAMISALVENPESVLSMSGSWFLTVFILLISAVSTFFLVRLTGRGIMRVKTGTLNILR